MSFMERQKLFEKKLIAGQWTLDQNKTYAGTLSYDITEGIKLNISGSNDVFYRKLCEKYNVVNGVCFVDGYCKNATIFDACVEQTHSSGCLGEQTLIFRDFWIGRSHFSSPQEVKFKKVTFKLNNLAHWIDNRHVYDFDMRPPKKYIYSLTAPDEIFLYEDEYVRITIQYIIHLPALGCPEKSSMYYVPHISCEAKEESLLYYGCKKGCFEYYIYAVCKLFFLLLRGATYLYNIVGYNKVEDQGTLYEVDVEHFYARDITHIQKQEVLPLHVFLPLKDLDSELPIIVQKYFEEYEKLDSLCGDLLCSLTSDSYRFNNLANLIYNLEGFIRIYYPEFEDQWAAQNAPEKDEYLQKVQQIVDCCPEELKAFAKKHLTLHCPFNKRIKNLLKKFKHLFPFLKNNEIIKSIAKKISDLRIKAAHAKGTMDEAIEENFFAMLYFVEFLQLAIILSVIGVPDRTIKKCFEYRFNSKFNFMNQEIEKYYAKRKEAKK